MVALSTILCVLAMFTACGIGGWLLERAGYFNEKAA